MIDLNATGNFISFKIIKKFILFKRRKISPIELMIINKTPIFQNDGLIKFEIPPLLLKIYEYKEII